MGSEDYKFADSLAGIAEALFLSWSILIILKINDLQGFHLLACLNVDIHSGFIISVSKNALNSHGSPLHTVFAFDSENLRFGVVFLCEKENSINNFYHSSLPLATNYI